MKPPLGLYVHLPWCERKCPYCDFNSHQAEAIPEREYVSALLADLETDRHLAQGRRIQTIFIGGGTPSLFSARAIDALLQGLHAQLDIAATAEITMEANPGSAEAAKFLGFREAGINRLSIGVQSFQDDKLQALGRVHSSEQAHFALHCARQAGFDNVNIDLMHGLPEQNRADALFDLQQAIDFGPSHLSWYQLTIEPNTVFNKHPPILPVEDSLADIQDAGEALLAKSGYSQYEVSAYSRSGMACRHNLNYWSFGDYMALGAGAHGKITSAGGCIERYSKTRGPGDYLAGSKRTASWRSLEADEVLEDFMLFALRLNNGFTLPHFEASTGLSQSVIATPIAELVNRNLLLQRGDRVMASALGRRFLDSVISEFLR